MSGYYVSNTLILANTFSPINRTIQAEAIRRKAELSNLVTLQVVENIKEVERIEDTENALTDSLKNDKLLGNKDK